MAGDPIKFTCPHCGKEFTCPHCGKEAVYAPPELSPEEQLKSMSIEELELSVRSYRCIKNLGIKTVGELIQRSPAELLRLANFGSKSLDEIRQVLESMNLSLAEPSSRRARGHSYS